MTHDALLTRTLQAIPGRFLVLAPIAPFIITAVSDSLLDLSNLPRGSLVGSALFDVLHSGPAAEVTGETVGNTAGNTAGDTALILAALETMRQSQAPMRLMPQRFVLQTAGDQSGVTHHFVPELVPVLSLGGQLDAIVFQLGAISDAENVVPALPGEVDHSPLTAVSAKRPAAEIQTRSAPSNDIESSTDDPEAIGRLSLATKAAGIGTFDWNLANGEILGNATCLAHYYLDGDAHFNEDLFYKLVHPDDRDRIRRAVDHALHHGAPYDLEYRVLAPDGRSRWLLAKGQVSTLPDGQSARLCGITIDISSYKRAEDLIRESEEEARAAREVAEHASQVKDEFLSTLSHELRTPLNSILGWTQVLQRSSSRMSEKATTALATIERSARQQARLIDDLLDASAIMAGKIHLDRQPIRSQDILNASVAMSAPAAALRNIRIDVAIDEPGVAIYGDQTRLQQVFCRLLSNAIKFSTNGSVVTVRQLSADQRVIVTVSDTGQGIAPAFLPSLFARFSQADGSITRTHMGLGLGLSIVKSLIELHGGRVSASSAGIAQGATFTVELPALSTSVPLPARIDDGLAGSEGDASTSDSLSAWTADIVVVDDEPDAATIMVEILQDAGATVRMAHSANEALALIRSRRPDLLISDIGMPQIDGFQLLKLLRAEESSTEIPLPAIALTAFARAEDKQRAIAAGFLMHLAKPVESTDLVTAAKLAVRRPNRAVDN